MAGLKDNFLRFERVTTGASMLAACAMLAVASGLGLFQIFRPAHVDPVFPQRKHDRCLAIAGLGP